METLRNNNRAGSICISAKDLVRFIMCNKSHDELWAKIIGGVVGITVVTILYLLEVI